MTLRPWIRLAPLLVAVACVQAPGETDDDDDATGDDDDAGPPDYIEDPIDPPEGISVSDVIGTVVLPDGFRYRADELSVQTYLGGDVRVRSDGTFTTTMNVDGVGVLELRDPDGEPLWLTIHARGEDLVRDDVVVSAGSGVLASMYLVPGITMDEPVGTAVLLEAFAGRPSFADAAGALAVDLAADPMAWHAPSAAVMAATEAVAGEFLELIPESAAALREAAEAESIDGSGQRDARETDQNETNTDQFADLNGVRDDLVKMTATFEGADPTLMDLTIENHGARPVWVYQDQPSTDFGVFFGDFRILAIVGARNTGIPTPLQIITELATTLGGALTVLFTPGLSVVDYIGQRMSDWLTALIGPNAEPLEDLDLTDYHQSTVSVYGLGLPLAHEASNPALFLRHVLPVVHGVIAQFVLPILSVVTNGVLRQAAGKEALRSVEAWETALGLFEGLASALNEVFQSHSATHSYTGSLASLAGVIRSSFSADAFTWLLALVGVPTSPAAIQRQMQTILGRLVASMNAVTAAVNIANMMLTGVGTLVTAVSVKWTDTYRVDLFAATEDEPDGGGAAGAECTGTALPELVVLGRGPGVGGIATYALDPGDPTALQRVPIGGLGECSLGVGQPLRDAAVGGPFDDWVYASTQNGYLAVFDLYWGGEFDVDYDPATTSDGAPEGITRTFLGTQPRGVELATIDGIDYGFVAVEEGVVAFDAYSFQPLFTTTNTMLEIQGSERAYDVAVVGGDRLYVTYWGGFSSPSSRTAVIDLQEALGQGDGAGVVQSIITTGGNTNNQWLQVSPDGSLVAVTNPNTDRVAIIDTSTDAIFDVGAPGVPSQFTGNPLFDPSVNPQAVAWTQDMAAVYGGYIGGGSSTSLATRGTVRRCEFALGECRHAVGVEGSVRGLAVLGAPGSEVVAVIDDGGGITLLPEAHFMPSAATSGTGFNGLFDGTGGCLGGTIGTIAEPCPAAAELGQGGGVIVPVGP